jgi:hypothetical protein
MAIAKSRITENSRTYSGEESAEMLVNWLNHTNDEDAKARIMQVVSVYLELSFLCRENSAARERRVVGRKWVQNDTPEAHKRATLETELNEALEYYQTRPWITFADRYRTDTRAWIISPPHFSSLPAKGSEFAQKMKERRKSHPLPKLSSKREPAPPGTQMEETGAIRYTLALLESGYIFKIRRCRCERFFFQRFSHQRFCSEKCRTAEFRTSDEARLKRNAYARKLYELHKTKNVK